jgi:hypothetical protein
MTTIDEARARLRRAAIRQALYTAWPQPMGPGLIAEALPDDLKATPDELGRALYYLCDRSHVTPCGASGPIVLYRLAPDGVDKVEGDVRADVSRVHAVRMLRLRVLQALSWGGPAPMGISLIGAALSSDTDLDLSERSIKRALAYLVERGLSVVNADSNLWRIHAAGTDYLGGDGPDIPGVARPVGW